MVAKQDTDFSVSAWAAAAHQWEASGETEGLLWHDSAAADARAWLEGGGAGPEGSPGLASAEELPHGGRRPLRGAAPAARQ